MSTMQTYLASAVQRMPFHLLVGFTSNKKSTSSLGFRSQISAQTPTPLRARIVATCVGSVGLFRWRISIKIVWIVGLLLVVRVVSVLFVGLSFRITSRAFCTSCIFGELSCFEDSPNVVALECFTENRSLVSPMRLFRFVQHRVRWMALG